jgi:hypothetical protein
MERYYLAEDGLGVRSRQLALELRCTWLEADQAARLKAPRFTEDDLFGALGKRRKISQQMADTIWKIDRLLGLIASSTQNLSQLLHQSRSLSRMKHQLTLVPELFSGSVARDRLIFMSSELREGAALSHSHALDLWQSLRRAQKTETVGRFAARRWKMLESRAWQKSKRVAVGANDIHRFVRGSLRPVGQTAVQQVMLERLAPLLSYLTADADLTGLVMDFLDDSLQRVYLSSQKDWAIREVSSKLTSVRKELWHEGSQYLLYGGASVILDNGMAAAWRPALRAPAPAHLSSEPTSLRVPPWTKISVVAPWRDSTSLYPQRSAIPIHYADSYAGITRALHRFGMSGPVAFDTISLDRIGRGAEDVDYLILAEEAEVAIFHLGSVDRDRLSSPHWSLPLFLADASILKIGLGVQPQLRNLHDLYGIEVENVLDLVADTTPSSRGLARSSNSRGSVISSMATKLLGSPLPELDLLASRTLRSTSFWAHRSVRSPGDPRHPLSVIKGKAVFSPFRSNTECF